MDLYSDVSFETNIRLPYSSIYCNGIQALPNYSDKKDKTFNAFDTIYDKIKKSKQILLLFKLFQEYISLEYTDRAQRKEQIEEIKQIYINSIK